MLTPTVYPTPHPSPQRPACAAVDLKSGGWQYLIFDRNGTSWYVRRPGFYPTREEAMAAAVVELEAQS